jgi:hypothetical protein
MHVSARLRSSTALVFVVSLFASTALPLTLCAAESDRACCTEDMPRQTAPHSGCHESENPPVSLSCCCDRDDATVPAITPATIIFADGSLSVVVPAVAAAAPTTKPLNHVLETTVHRIHARPLFTLFSAFLI